MGILGKIRHLSFKLKLRFSNAEQIAEMMRPQFYHLGKNVKLYTTRFGTEPYLISIHDNVTCAAGVEFVNHDVSCYNAARYLGLPEGSLEKCGSIVLYENAFVGANTMLMPNTSVGRNSVVAAGSIVTKHIPDGEVWGGVPAKFIMKTDEYARKIMEQSLSRPWVSKETYRIKDMSEEELIAMRQNYFFGK